MPIDREARREVVLALSAFMRGEIDNFAFDVAIHKKSSRDQALEAFRTALWFVYDDCKCHRISVTETCWNYLRRQIAFLKSDLEETPIRRLVPDSVRRGRFLLGLGSLMSISATGYLAVRDSWFWLCMPGLLIGLPFCGFHVLRDRFTRKGQDLKTFYPFASGPQWERYEPLLEEERLPKFDPAIHCRPIRSGVFYKLAHVPAVVFASLVLTPILMLVLLLPRKHRNPS